MLPDARDEPFDPFDGVVGTRVAADDGVASDEHQPERRCDEQSRDHEASGGGAHPTSVARPLVPEGIGPVPAVPHVRL